MGRLEEKTHAVKCLQVFVTKTGQPFIISASGTLGWDMVAANLVEPGEDVLVLNTGFFGDRWVQFAVCSVYRAFEPSLKSDE